MTTMHWEICISRCCIRITSPLVDSWYIIKNSKLIKVREDNELND